MRVGAKLTARAPNSATTSVLPSARKRTSRGKASVASVLTTLFRSGSIIESEAAAGVAKRFELATQTCDPSGRTATATGASPTAIFEIGTGLSTPRRLLVSKARRALSPRAVTQAIAPFGERATRTGLQPAGTMAVTASARPWVAPVDVDHHQGAFGIAFAADAVLVATCSAGDVGRRDLVGDIEPPTIRRERDPRRSTPLGHVSNKR